MSPSELQTLTRRTFMGSLIGAVPAFRVALRALGADPVVTEFSVSFTEVHLFDCRHYRSGRKTVVFLEREITADPDGVYRFEDERGQSLELRCGWKSETTLEIQTVSVSLVRDRPGAGSPATRSGRSGGTCNTAGRPACC